MRSFGKLSMLEHICLDGEDLNAVNTFENPYSVEPHNLDIVTGEFDSCELRIPKLSWNVIRFKLK